MAVSHQHDHPHGSFNPNRSSTAPEQQKDSGSTALPLKFSFSRIPALLFHSRYSLLFSFVVLFLLLSALVRTVLLLKSYHGADLSAVALSGVYLKGFLYDTATAVFISLPYSLYLLVLPEKINNSSFNRIFTWFFFSVLIAVIILSSFAEIPFWTEFESRFNFIAVDYLIYTYEVVNNIRQSYPMPLLLGGMALVTALIAFYFYRRKIFYRSFHANTPFRARLPLTGCIVTLACLCSFLSNSWADTGHNRYRNELSKDGLFSFMAAFRTNELNYFDFYRKTDSSRAFQTIRTELQEPNAVFTGHGPIRRMISHAGAPLKPNVVLVTIESLSADFLKRFGNKEDLTPTLDSLAKEGIVFNDMYATGTRTVRGLEALTLCVPPTPGNSIVRKPDNNDLFNTGTVFAQQGYSRSFFYGGNGYFDNMNTFFGHNGFDITDRQGRLIPHESLQAKHSFISDSNVHFENAWGICDEDLYDAVIRAADSQALRQQSFFDFVMTTSNHRPFTYPDGKIDIPSGSGREGAVKYTDYAIRRFLQKAAARPWFSNTVFIFVADHCASSAGKDDIDVGKYHIPCVIYNLKASPSVIGSQCSQIDLFPTLFGLLNWSYESNLYGKDVREPGYKPRALVGTYQQLGYLEQDSLAVLSPQRKVSATRWDRTLDLQQPMLTDSTLLDKATAYYQTAYFLYKKGGLRK